MTGASRPTNSLFREGEAAVAQAAPWIERVARLGFAAKAVLYAIVGVLALQVALGSGGRTTGSRGALTEIIEKPFGKAMLIIVALGLIGYAVWRVIEGIADPEHKGSSPKGLALRTSFVARGIAHGALAIEAIRLATASGGGGGDGNTRHWVSRVLEAPFGEWLVALAGAGIVAYGAYQLYRAFVAKLSKQLDLAALTREAGEWAIRISRFGIAARGIVFGMIGVTLARAGMSESASRAAGVGEALRALGSGPQGRWILGAVAAGLIAYGVYEVIEARYRRIRTS